MAAPPPAARKLLLPRPLAESRKGNEESVVLGSSVDVLLLLLVLRLDPVCGEGFVVERMRLGLTVEPEVLLAVPVLVDPLLLLPLNVTPFLVLSVLPLPPT